MKKFDYTSCKNETEVKKIARKDLIELFFNFLCETFGEENVKMVERNTIGFIFGDAIDNDNFPCDVVSTISPIIKNYQDHVGEKRSTEAYDFYEAAKEYRKNYENS